LAGTCSDLPAGLCFDLKYDGVVSFAPKTQLVEHYQKTLGAKLFGPNRMFIDTREASILSCRERQETDGQRRKGVQRFPEITKTTF
jgi:hypothetical protein